MHLRTVALLDQAHRHLAGAEARHAGGLWPSNASAPGPWRKCRPGLPKASAGVPGCRLFQAGKPSVVEFRWVGCSRKGRLVRLKGLEPSHLAAPEPKSGASTNFATAAGPEKGPVAGAAATYRWAPLPVSGQPDAARDVVSRQGTGRWQRVNPNDLAETERGCGPDRGCGTVRGLPSPFAPETASGPRAPALYPANSGPGTGRQAAARFGGRMRYQAT